jgi:hypothetical protein
LLAPLLSINTFSGSPLALIACLKKSGGRHFISMPGKHKVILLDEIIQVFDLADSNIVTGFLLENIDSRRIGAAFVYRDLVR